MKWLRTAILLVFVLLAGACATGPKKLGVALDDRPWALAPSQIEVWQPFGRVALPNPPASVRSSEDADLRLRDSLNWCAEVRLNASQAALFEHLATLLRRDAGLWRSAPGVGPVALPPGCHGLLIVRGRLQPMTAGWLALGVVDGGGNLVAFRSVESVTTVHALARLLDPP